VRLTVIAVLAVTALAACGHAPARRLTGTAPSTSATPATPAPSGSSAAPSPPASAAAAAGGPCSIFPADNVWHATVSALPVRADSATLVASIGASKPGHPDFGAGFGFPVTTVHPGQATVAVSFDYKGESDKGPYPIPANVQVEDGGDGHIILYDPAACRAYELYAAQKRADGSWHAGSGAIYDLRSNKLRPAGWTSADAAGLPILAGLVRYDEVAAGRVDHAIRMTVPTSRNTYLWPGRHAASSHTDAALPPMGLRLRLKSTVDVAAFPPQARAVAVALQRYGAIVADNGSSWFFSGTDDSRWSNRQLDALKSLRGSDFEVVDESRLMVDPNSGAVRR
jgi:hypothetical protein